MEAFDPNRRALFSRLRPVKNKKNMFTRPPQADIEVEFLRKCSQCGHCVRACPSNLIALEHGFPILGTGCDGCLKCVISCPTDALLKDRVKILIDYRCKANIAQHCMSCCEVCPTSAITIEPSSRPAVEIDKCVGCGDCVTACEFNAIALTH